MRINIGKLTSMTAILAALTATPAMVQEVGGGWDLDGDDRLTRSEFVQGFAQKGVFARWDKDGDGVLSEDELTQGAYRTFDRDMSGDLDETEYGLTDRRMDNRLGSDRMGAARYWSDAETGYEPWDIDGDGIILMNEFAAGLAEAGMFDEWDMNDDGALSEEEFATGVFNRYDENGDGVIEEPELTDIGDDMGDEGFWDV